MFAHAQQKYSRSVHFRFVAAQDFMIQTVVCRGRPESSGLPTIRSLTQPA